MAWLSSYLTLINFEKIRRSIANIILPMWSLMTSFVWVVRGYVDMAIDYYGSLSTIVAGSVLLLLTGASFVLYKYDVSDVSFSLLKFQVPSDLVIPMLLSMYVMAAVVVFTWQICSFLFFSTSTNFSVPQTYRSTTGLSSSPSN